MSDFEEEDAFGCKVILVGESGVGKLSIISRFLKDNFSKTSTTGVNFHTKTIFFKEENKSIRYEIWDTAGQEKFRSLSKIFYKNAAVCILVYDITKRQSFEELKLYWIEEIKAQAPKDISKLRNYLFI